MLQVLGPRGSSLNFAACGEPAMSNTASASALLLNNSPWVPVLTEKRTSCPFLSCTVPSLGRGVPSTVQTGLPPTTSPAIDNASSLPETVNTPPILEQCSEHSKLAGLSSLASFATRSRAIRPEACGAVPKLVGVLQAPPGFGFVLKLAFCGELAMSTTDSAVCWSGNNSPCVPVLMAKHTSCPVFSATVPPTGSALPPTRQIGPDESMSP